MRKLLVLLLVILFVIAGWADHRQHTITTAFEQTALGSQVSVITQQLGDPWKASDCGHTFGGTVPKACVNELLYASPFAPVIPEYWAFRYDQNGRMIDKYRYVSP